MGESPEAVCSAEVDDNEPCMDAEQCKNRRCGLSFGIQCVSDDRNCLCIPGLGFKEGTRSVEARNCDSGEVTQENGINICTKGDDTVRHQSSLISIVLKRFSCNCDSGEVTQENGINICTKGDDTI